MGTMKATPYLIQILNFNWQRQSWGCLIFMMGMLILEGWYLYLETVHRTWMMSTPADHWMFINFIQWHHYLMQCKEMIKNHMVLGPKVAVVYSILPCWISSRCLNQSSKVSGMFFFPKYWISIFHSIKLWISLFIKPHFLIMFISFMLYEILGYQ